MPEDSMTDDGRHISRRERRAQEEREAANVPADTDALSLGPISESIPTHAPDGRMLTRRERRRLERARQPMETWTAEEEMIATGQIPAMTPERIAEQEKLARERAAAAQREAQEASAELEGLAGNPAVAQSAAAPATEPVVESASEPEQQHPWAPVTPAPVEPHADQPWAPVTQPSAPAPAEQEPQQPWSPSAPATSDQEVATEFVPEPAPAWAPAQPHDENPSGGATPPERTSLIAAVAAEAAPTAPVVESAE